MGAIRERMIGRLFANHHNIAIGTKAPPSCRANSAQHPLSDGAVSTLPKMPDMKILLSNDDGYQAPGIVALYEALKDLADVEVVAPQHNNSAKSNALTLHSPLYVHRAANGFRYVNGTPADCVHIALTGLLGYRPDLVVSSINNGANMGDDTIYSGTVGAAMEGYLFGIPAIAFSQTEKGWAHLDSTAAAARQLVQQLMPATRWSEGAEHPKTHGCWRTHGGPLAAECECAQRAVGRLAWLQSGARLGRRHAAEAVITQTSPRGETMYWIGSAGPARRRRGHRFSCHRTGLCHHHAVAGRSHAPCPAAILGTHSQQLSKTLQSLT